MKVYEMILAEDDLEFGMNIISIVDDPANQEEFLMLSKQTENLQLASDEERQMLYGVVLSPDQKVLRNPEGEDPYYITFSAPTIRDVSRRFMSLGKQNNVDLEHSRDILEGVTVTESWLVEDTENDKTKALGLNASDGAWVIGTHIPDKEQWLQLKASNKTGFSVDGRLHRKLVEDKPVDILMELIQMAKDK